VCPERCSGSWTAARGFIGLESLWSAENYLSALRHCKAFGNALCLDRCVSGHSRTSGGSYNCEEVEVSPVTAKTPRMMGWIRQW
jgi:hypothetical protein